MNRFLLMSVGTLSCILLGVLFGGSSASAASDWDNLQTVDKAVIKDIKNGTSHDVTKDFYELWRENQSQTCINARGSFNRALENGAWSISLYNNNAAEGPKVNEMNMFALVWHENTKNKQSFTKYGSTNMPILYTDPNDNTTYPQGSMRLYYSDDVLYVQCNTTSVTGFMSFNANEPQTSGSNLKLLLTTYDLVYPVGYEGPELPSSNNEECLRECRIVIAPNFEYDYDDKQISVTDLENNLLPVFEPDEGYTTVGYEIEWSLWKCSVEYDNGLCKNGENELVELKHTPLLEGNTWNDLDYGYYRVEAQYVVQQCYRYPSYPATPDYCFYVDLGTEFGKVYLFEKRSRSINLDGTSGSGNTSDENCDVSGECTSGTVGGLLPCFGPDPPFVQVDGCVKNIFWVVDSLSFSKITIMEIRSNTMQCKQLDTIGGWINRPGITVCPMFPSHVRDVVTPFITLAIGLFLGSFIMRLASRGVR